MNVAMRYTGVHRIHIHGRADARERATLRQRAGR